MSEDLNEKLLDWFFSGKTGMSSQCMAARLTGRKILHSHPSDSGDFKRCLELLDAVPELRSRLSGMRHVSKQWAALVEHWDEIEKKVRADDDDTYELMDSILRPINSADANTFCLGNGVSLKIGVRP